MGVFRESLKEPTIDAIFGSINGVEGIIHDHLIDLKTMILTNEDMELLRQTPSTVLGSCRYKLPDWQEDDAVYQQIVHCLKRRQIGAFFYIGGNDSMDTVQKLSSYFREKKLDIKVIGIPKTIDNDLCITDHTPGFGSAAKYVATTMQEIVRDSSVYSMPSITIVEIMGRHAGWLTASSAVLHAYGDPAPHLVYVRSPISRRKSSCGMWNRRWQSIRQSSWQFPRALPYRRACSPALWITSGISTSPASASIWNSWCGKRSDVRCAPSS